MSFFYGQESLSVFQWVLRGLVGYLFLLFAVKLMGQRSISQLRLLDFITALVLGNIVAHPLSDEKLGLQGAMLTTTVIIFLYTVGTLLTLKSGFCRKLFESSPVIVVKHGQIIESGLNQAKLSIESLLSELRKNRIFELKNVALAIWEPGGTVSVFPESQFRPLTPVDMQIQPKPFSLPMIIIKEGKINYETLRKIRKDEQWLRIMLNKTAKMEISDLLLATIDVDNTIHLVPKSLHMLQTGKQQRSQY